MVFVHCTMDLTHRTTLTYDQQSGASASRLPGATNASNEFCYSVLPMPEGLLNTIFSAGIAPKSCTIFVSSPLIEQSQPQGLDLFLSCWTRNPGSNVCVHRKRDPDIHLPIQLLTQQAFDSTYPQEISYLSLPDGAIFCLFNLNTVMTQCSLFLRLKG